MYRYNKVYSHVKTSNNEGKDFGKVIKLWEKLAISESKLEMMGRMVKNRVGFNEIEDFVSKIEKKITEKERQHNRGGNRRSLKIIETTMAIKLHDERRKHSRLLKEKKEMVRTIVEDNDGDRDKVRKVMRKLRKFSKRKKKELREKNTKKLEHLIEKQKQREEKTRLWKTENNRTDDITTEIENIKTTSAFIETRFDKIEKQETEPCTVGEVELNENEKELMKMHPKFAVRTDIDREQFELDIECGFTKLRWEIGKEEENEKEKEQKEVDRKRLTAARKTLRERRETES